MHTKLRIIIFLVFITGCGIIDAIDDNFNGTMEAQVNGKLITFNDAYGDRILGDDMNWSGITKIVGITDRSVSGYEIQIDFPYNPAKGKIFHPYCMYRTWTGKYYDYNNIKAYLTESMNPEGSEFSSTLTFTSITAESYEGTFSFVAHIVDNTLKDSVIVSNGMFKISSSGRKWYV